MKSQIRKLLILAVAAGLISVPAVAQRKTTKEDEGKRARGLFVNKKADGMSLLVLKLDEGQLVPVDPAHQFKKGDQIKVEFQSNFDGMIYVVNISPTGKRRLLFPYPGAQNNTVQSGQRYTIPAGGDLIEFDNERGTEVLQVIMTKDRIATLDAAAKTPEGWLSETAASAAEELQGGITNKDVTPAVPDEDRSKIRSRDIILSAGKTKEKQGSVVAIPDKDGTGGRLKSGEIAPFELRLKHN
jgi:hypothetical protein